jgi:hypothetical protein
VSRRSHNGKTAGQIAIANGAAASTILHGPGNSQPHKAAGCAGRNPGSNPISTVSSEPEPETSAPAAAPGTPADPGTSQPAGGVASGSTQGSQGVLGAAAVVAHGTLPSQACTCGQLFSSR